MAMAIHRGSAESAVAASLILPSNTALILRGDAASKFVAAYGPVPQNRLLRSAPVVIGTVASIDLPPNGRGVGPSFLYVPVISPFSPVATIDEEQVRATMQSAVNMAQGEGRLPCAVSFPLEAPWLNNPENIAVSAKILVDIIGNLPGFSFYSTDETYLNAVFQAVAAAELKPSASKKKASVPEEVVEADEIASVVEPSPEASTHQEPVVAVEKKPAKKKASVGGNAKQGAAKSPKLSKTVKPKGSAT